MKKSVLFFVALMMSVVLPVQADTNDGGLIYKGPYTATGMAYNYNTGQYSNTGISAVNQVEIYSDRLVINGRSYEKWNTDGQWYWYGRNANANNHPEYLYNTATGEMRWRFIFNFYGLQISDNFWYRGNQLSTGGGGSYGGGSYGGGSYGNSGSSSSSTTRTPHRCGLCDGKGWVPTDEGVSTFGNTDKKYCKECGQWVYLNHWHKTCPSCNGKGAW